MSENSSIEWTDATWNLVGGCTKVSPGCDNCYAEVMARRFPERVGGGSGAPFDGHRPIVPLWNRLDAAEPYFRWRKPRRVFVCSTSDLFHTRVPFEFIAGAFRIMAETPHHTYQVLTKRPGRMAAFAAQIAAQQWHGLSEWPANVWAGTSVESQKYAPRLDVLARVPAPVRFVSAEPLLSGLDLGKWLAQRWRCSMCGGVRLDGEPACAHDTEEFGRVVSGDGIGPVLSWVIVGGESGPKARPAHPDWVRSLRDQATAAGVPFFFKQWGEWAPMDAVGASSWTYVDGRGGILRRPDGSEALPSKLVRYAAPYAKDIVYRVGRRAAGAVLDGQMHREFPAPTEPRP